ncbi:MAG TPA: MarR family winged helix-turn-helix transcriptional regulator [Bacillota bacterium]|jgi:DNA-binding MarR family transcriptional regulator|nr:MarR family winged helix-turn-helix transcriptional regulator [Bacillota bacterium]HQE66522.1 MarR family winged helix-turn-helix transcriptional regulator [Bacillota bacterium]HQI17202.1 MarR family winged helix-turn-helix transcriptional regulator [Bacillota bacterium]HQL35896.1 MarR family winged helix-turn-helix transcriptional regulator [Bacillota bacterium]
MEVTEFKNIVFDYTRKINESLNCAFSPAIGSRGLTMMQTRILMELHRCDSHTIGSLADSICAAGTNISAMCKKLEGQGFIERIRNRNDERVVRVVLTRLGKETVLELEELFDERISKCLKHESEETFEDIIQGMQKLNELLTRIINNE